MTPEERESLSRISEKEKRRQGRYEMQTLPYLREDDHPFMKENASGPTRARALRYPRARDLAEIRPSKRQEAFQFLATSTAVNALRTFGDISLLVDLADIIRAQPGPYLGKHLQLPTRESLLESDEYKEPAYKLPAPGSCCWTILDLDRVISLPTDTGMEKKEEGVIPTPGVMRPALSPLPYWHFSAGQALLFVHALTETGNGRFATGVPDDVFKGISPRAVVDMFMGRQYAQAQDMLARFMEELTGSASLSSIPGWTLSGALRLMTYGPALDQAFEYQPDWKDRISVPPLASRSVGYKNLDQTTLTGVFKGGAKHYLQLRFKYSITAALKTLKKTFEHMENSLEYKPEKYQDPDLAVKHLKLIQAMSKRINNQEELEKLYWDTVQGICTDTFLNYGDAAWPLHDFSDVPEEKNAIAGKVIRQALTRIITMQWMGRMGSPKRAEHSMSARAMVAISLVTGVPLRGMLDYFIPAATRSGYLCCDSTIYSEVLGVLDTIKTPDLLSLCPVAQLAGRRDPGLLEYLTEKLTNALEDCKQALQIRIVEEDGDPVATFMENWERYLHPHETSPTQGQKVMMTARTVNAISPFNLELLGRTPDTMVLAIFRLNLEDPF